MLLRVCYISQISGQWSRKPEQLCVNLLITVGCLDVWHTAMKMTWLNDEYVDFMTNRCSILCLCHVQMVLHLQSISNNENVLYPHVARLLTCSKMSDPHCCLFWAKTTNLDRKKLSDWHAKRPTTVFVQKTKFSFSIHFLSEILHYKNN